MAHRLLVRALVPALVLVLPACSGSDPTAPESASESEQPVGELAQAAGTADPLDPLDYDGPLKRTCGCADLVEYTVPAGGCFAIAYGLWGSIDDDVACVDLSPSDSCTRTCTGYFEAKNPTNAPIKILAYDKLTGSEPGHAQPGVMTSAVEQCNRMFSGPQQSDSYKNTDAFVPDASGLLVRGKGGPTAASFPPPGKSVCN